MIKRDSVTRFFASGFISWIIFTQAPENNIRIIFKNLFASQNAPLHGINNTGDQFATGVNNTGGKFATCTAECADVADTGGK